MPRRIIAIHYIVLVLAIGVVPVYALTGEEIWSQYLSGENPDDLRARFLSVLDSAPDDPYAAAGIGFIAYSRYQSEEALKYWIRATESFGSDPVGELFLHLSFEAAEEIGGWKDHSDLCNRLIGRMESPSLVSTAMFYRAVSLRRFGKPKEAKAQLEPFEFIQEFLVCGPFDNAEKRGHDQTYGPEESFDPEASYPGRNREVGWEPLPVKSPWGYIDLKTYSRPPLESSTYLAAVIESESQSRARLLVGHAGALKVWINGIPAIDAKRYHGPFPDQVASQIELHKGANLLLLKVSSGENGKYGVWARLAALEGSEKTWRILPAGEGARDIPALARSVAGTQGPAFDEEPPAVAAMREMGSRLKPDSPRHLFYALLIDQYDIADEADQSEILTLTRSLEPYPDSAIVRFYAASADREPNRRRRFLEECVNNDPGFLRARTGLIDTFRSTPFVERRRALIDDALEIAPQEARFICRMAKLMADERLLDAAIGRARYAVELNPDIRDTWWTLADLGGELIPRKERIAIYERLVKRQSSDIDSLRHLAHFALKDNDVVGAERWIAKIRELDPWHFSLLRELSEFWLAQGNLDKAIETAQEGLSVSPHDPGLHKALAMAFRQRGDDKKASEHVSAILKTIPSDPWALDYSKHISPETADYYTPYRRDKDSLPEPSSDLLERANSVTLLHQEVKRVHPNGNSSQTVHDIIKVLTDSGLNALRSRAVYYEPATEEIRILRARVWKKDGTFVDSPAPTHRSTASAGDAASRLYGDYNVAIIAFPGIEKDATIELEYQVEQKGENIYADYFGEVFVIGDYEPTLLTEYILITPITRDFYHSYLAPNYPPSVTLDNTVFAEEPDESFEGSERIQKWTYRNLPLVRREPSMPTYSEVLPYLKISTFHDWDEMTTWWWNLSKDQFIPGPTVKQKVQEIIDAYRSAKNLGPEDPISDFEKVGIVNKFVNTDVRYLGLEFGIHGYKPHRVDEVCHAQYGDCKDKATLAVSMLEELGVEARPVILRTTDRGEIDYGLPSLGLFNHAIYYIPDADGKELWIDGTAQFFHATELPPGDEGSNSLIVEPGGKSVFKRIPNSPAERNGGHYQTRIALSGDGSGAGKRVADYEGLYNPIVRSTYENRSKAKDLVEQQLVGRYPGGKCLSVELSELEDYSTPERLVYEFEIPNFATPQGDELSLPSVFFPQSMSLRYAALSEREYDLVLRYRWSRSLEMIVTIPEGWELREMPSSVDEENQFGKFHWSGSVVDGEIHLNAEIQFKALRIEPDEYQAFRAFCQLIDNSEERRILLRRKR